MPRKKEPELSGDAIARAIKNDLPGWNLSKNTRVDDAALAETTSKATSGTTLMSLRKKFLGNDSADADEEAGGGNDDHEDYGVLESDQKTVQVEPKEGGASKVADIVKGKVKIVQG